MRRIATAVEGWLARRLPVAEVKEFSRKQASKPVPPHVSWWHTFGSLSLFLLANQVVTGILLMVYYRPTTEESFESVRYVTVEIAFGWFIRGLHHWGSSLMIVMVLLHMIRTFFMAAFKRPRELTWILGVLLFGTTLTFGFTGYLLPWNQLSYWATTVGTEVAGSIPVVGLPMKRMLLGGDTVSGETLVRFYVLHVAVLPWVITGLTGAHVVLMRVQGLATMDRVGEEAKADPKRWHPFFPDHVLKELAVFAIFFGGMMTLVLLLPPEMGEKADPLSTPAGIKPEWYFLSSYQLLKYFPKLLGIFVSFLPPLLLLLWPFIERNRERRWRGRKLWVAAGLFALVAAVAFGLMGHFAERDVKLFGKRYHVDHYGIPRAPETPHAE